MKIHITLVGGQPVPVYLGLKELQPEKIIYICSKSSRKEANTISSHYENISHEFIELDPVDITEIEAKAKSLYELYINDDVSINLSSGTKPWSLLFYICFANHKSVDYIYIDQNNYLNNIRTKEKYQIEVNKHIYFSLHGNPLNKYKDFKDYTEEDENVSRILEKIRHLDYTTFSKLTNPIDKEKQRTFKNTEGMFSLPNNSSISWNWNTNTVKIIINKNNEMTEFILSSPNIRSMVFNSGWFEYLVAKHISKNPRTRSVWMNCVFNCVSDPLHNDKSKNEIDIIADMGTKVLFVECKTHINNPTDIDKFKSAVNNYGGSGSKSLFVTYFPTDKDNSIKEKFSDNYMPNFAYNYKKPEYINCNELNSYINKILDTINKK